MSAKILIGPQYWPRPEDKYTLGELFFTTAKNYGNRLCQIDANSGRSESYESVNRRSVRLALALQKYGITRDDVVMVCSNNTMDNTIPLVAAMYLGAKICNVHPTLSVRLTQHIILLVKPKIIFVEESSLLLIEESLGNLAVEIKLVVMGMTSKYAKFTDWVSPNDSESTFRPVKVERDNVAALLFSSGTTGQAKAICHSHESLFMFVGKMMMESNVMLHQTPFYWLSAYYVLILMFINKGTRVFSSDVDGETWFRITEKFKVTSAFFSPIHSYKLTNLPNLENYNTTLVSKILLGGTPVNPKQLERLQQIFKNADIMFGYGLTETGCISLYTFDSNNYLEKLRTTGKILTQTQVKIVDPGTQQILPAYQQGEILVKSPSVMTGYFNGDAAQCFDKYGFLKTGDLGYFDKDEHLFVIGRSKEMFKYRTWHIVPEFIEGVLLEHPDVSEAVVFGIPHGLVGELPTACVVPKEGSNVTEQEIQDFVTQMVADWQKLRGGIYVVESLPKTPTGKIARKEAINSFAKLNSHNTKITCDKMRCEYCNNP